MSLLPAGRPVLNTPDQNATLNVGDVQRRFERAAATFDNADFVHRVMRDGLIARTVPMTVQARTVIDLGCATGAATGSLEKRFRGARITGIDLSHAMLANSRRRKTWRSKATQVQADARSLPVADHRVDVVFSNLLLPWFDDPGTVFTEIARVLRKDGLFAFATLGPDSLLELRRAWQAVDANAHVNRFPDMHDVGDALVRAGLRDPVLDVDRLAISYPDCRALFRDLTATGARNCLRGRNRGLVGRARFNAMIEALSAGAAHGELKLELELVYGHCWGRGPLEPRGGVRIDATNIPRRRR